MGNVSTIKLTAKEKAQSLEHATKRLRALVREDGYVSTITILGRGETDWVECFVPNEDGTDIEQITYYVSLVTGRTMTEKGIKLRGGGYSKPTEVVNDLSWVLFGRRDALSVNRLLG